MVSRCQAIGEHLPYPPATVGAARERLMAGRFDFIGGHHLIEITAEDVARDPEPGPIARAFLAYEAELESEGGLVGADGSYTAPLVAGTYHVAATSDADASARALAAVIVTEAAPAVALEVNPYQASLTPNQSLQFSATVSGRADTAVAWSIQEGAAGGVIGADGSYVAPQAEGKGPTTHLPSARPIRKRHASGQASNPRSIGCGRFNGNGRWSASR
jgi:hypothetical protein